jgi:transcriptional regulator with XRE-family HTH domain
MASIDFKLSRIRKLKGVSQKNLADYLGVTYQSVSKWETGVCMPDVFLLPDISKFFGVSIDELLGVKPLSLDKYIPRNSDDRDTWNNRADRTNLHRKYFWNNDYLQFLIDRVWKINSPVNIIEFRCGDGYLAEKFLNLLPEGSSYTGLDNSHFIDMAKKRFKNTHNKVNFLISDLYSYESIKKYDISICHAGLRHMNRPSDILKNMINTTKSKGLVVCVEVNREFEDKGFYIDNIDYNYLCTKFDLHKLWKNELEKEGRDHAVGMKIPFYMLKLGLIDVEVRLSDKVIFANSASKNYEELKNDYKLMYDLDSPISSSSKDNTIKKFMTRGLDRDEIENFIEVKTNLINSLNDKKVTPSFMAIHGLVISFGVKK